MKYRRLFAAFVAVAALAVAGGARADVREIDDDWGVVAGVKLGESPAQLHRWLGNADGESRNPDLELRWEYIVGRFRGDELVSLDCGGPRCRIGEELEFYLTVNQMEKKLGRTEHVDWEGQEALLYRIRGTGKELIIVGNDRPSKIILRYAQ